MNVRELGEPFQDVISMLRQAKEMLRAISETPDGCWLTYQPMAIKIRDVAESIKFGMPHAICNTCTGQGCTVCKDLGWIPKAREIAGDQ